MRETVKRLSALTGDEVELLKESTLQKLRSNVFKMLQEAELRSEAGYIPGNAELRMSRVNRAAVATLLA